MLLTRCGCCLVSAIVIMVSIFGQSTAQNFSNTTTIDLTSSRSRFTRMVIIPRVPLLRILLPESASLEDLGSVSRKECTADGYMCVGVVPMNGFELRYTLDTLQTVNITVDQTYEVGCSNYMHPVDATTSSDAEVSLSCVPVPVNPADFEVNATIEWRRFSRLEELLYFVQNCSDFPENCSSQFRDDNYLISRLNSEFRQTDHNLTIINPASSRAWYVPSFTVNGSRTYVAPYTFLYRWPRILSHYEFSLEVFEPASNYDRLQCEAESFPPLEAFAWTRDDTPIDSSSPRYTFTNVTTGERISAKITISEVMFEDSALFTCNVANFGGLLETDVLLSVRLRVKHRLRPLWPALGIIGVGILVALFIIIGHFWDKAIEKYQNEPSNPSHHKRLQSITSTADETSNNVPSGKKQSGSQANQVKYTVGGHVAVKRLSSQRIQLLEEAQ